MCARDDDAGIRAMLGITECRRLTNIRLRDACLTIWFVSGVLLALSQIVFICVALGMKAGASRVVVLACGTIITLRA